MLRSNNLIFSVCTQDAKNESIQAEVIEEHDATNRDRLREEVLHADEDKPKGEAVVENCCEQVHEEKLERLSSGVAGCCLEGEETIREEDEDHRKPRRCNEGVLLGPEQCVHRKTEYAEVDAGSKPSTDSEAKKFGTMLLG